MKTIKEIKLKLLTRIENLSRYDNLDDYQKGTISGLKDVLEMWGYNYAERNDSATRLLEIKKLRRI